LAEEFDGNNIESKDKVKAVCAGNFSSYPERSIENKDIESEGPMLHSWAGHYHRVEGL
jgi:hypothetical protein